MKGSIQILWQFFIEGEGLSQNADTADIGLGGATELGPIA